MRIFLAQILVAVALFSAIHAQDLTGGLTNITSGLTNGSGLGDLGNLTSGLGDLGNLTSGLGSSLNLTGLDLPDVVEKIFQSKFY